MKKTGFTLMELLVSIFITGMVMLSLVAMWKTSSSHTSQAQRQSIIKNENTIFLRKFYTDFVSASEIICPWALSYGFAGCSNNTFIAINNAKVLPDTAGNLLLVRTTGPLCNSNFGTGVTSNNISKKCLKPSYTAYIYEKSGIYKCSNTFLENTNASNNMVSLESFMDSLASYCSDASHKELILPYVSSFKLEVPTEKGRRHNEALLLDYTLTKNFSGDVPPILIKFKRYFIKDEGV